MKQRFFAYPFNRQIEDKFSYLEMKETQQF